ncbi:LexA family protein [Pseudomonas fulva]|uniref:Peptidase S24/S26A/S26B, conserved region n=1 Tax=Pseudomonas fulva (strain 12-X) TaxID=743720 RepID=F6AG49_PSEF1|nr:S24 family peptidase [Pseudomonas fulva]AEF21451.1 Peptidase S24/S26A/S26B, conserved region [Pseudomonas fulva 12-X]
MGNASFLCLLKSSSAVLPFLSARVPAGMGFPSPAADHIERKVSLDELLDIDAPQTYLVRAHGESMTGVGIFHDDVMVVNRALDAGPGDVVIAAINGDTLVKTFCREGDQIILRSENPKYAPRYVLEGDELMVWGVVITNLRSLRQYG